MNEKDPRRADEDWKTRAEEARRKLEEKLRSKPEEELRLPPASFMTIVSTFVTQAMVALGEMAMPGAETRELDPEGAKFAIDSLGILKEKTAGNLAAEDERALDEVLQGLRLYFVQKVGQAGK